MLINGIKFACSTCVKGHRSSNCNHIERPLFEIRKKGRPVTQCAFCRDLRKTKQIHIKCTCTDKSKSSGGKNIENTATQQHQCYQCPSATEEQGVSYSDLIQSSLLNNNGQPQQDGAVQCTCHETANKMLFQQEQDNNSTAPVTTRGMVIEESSLLPSNSKSLRFLGGQAKNPRRKSSTSSSASKRRSIQKQDIISQQDDTMMVDMQSFLFNQRQQTELETDCAVAVNNLIMVNNAYPSNSSTSTTISTSSSTPNSNYAYNKEDIKMMDNNNDIGLMITDPDELTSLLNNVLNDTNTNKRRQSEQENMAMDTQQYMTAATGVDMTRSTTNNSISSCCSSSAKNNFIAPLQQQQQHQVICGLTPHSNCSPAIDSQGESVVITITPLSTLFTASDEESQAQQQQQQENLSNKPVTRIVTCYCGNSCICPGCFVHPDNYLLRRYTMQQQEQHNMQQLQLQHPSSNASSYSSDDEDQYHHMNYTVTAATSYSSLL